MRTNSFTTNMRTKSNKELETILKEKNNYTKEAIQAVTWELEDRNIIEKTVDISKEITEEDQITDTSIAKKTLENNESPFKELEVPFLYSKKAILGFTIFFSTIFGAVLLMQNLKEMNKPKARIEVLVFGILYILFSAVLSTYLPQMMFIPLLFNIIGYAVLTEYYWNKNLGKDFAYQKKPIWQPLATSILIVLLLVILLYFTTTFG
ncbi:hypothetical protein [Polaribacter sp. Q13]|uniref:hypothetical protein n=1 Tax=Polaribacter sp. Q13 TaxID=2806551 RepID=UPI00193B5F55|nr:hypothetical protein [Polaribacter sp. Q13]QVY65141.1 hypothetical protein JOP69_15525 [Polaribacter sp. Q13]